MDLGEFFFDLEFVVYVEPGIWVHHSHVTFAAQVKVVALGARESVGYLLVASVAMNLVMPWQSDIRPVSGVNRSHQLRKFV